MVKCKLCGKEFKSLTPTHLKKAHGTTMADYREKFPDAPLRNVSEEQRKNYSKASIKRWADPEYKAANAPRLVTMAANANKTLQQKRKANPEFNATWLESVREAQDKNKTNFCKDCGIHLSTSATRCRECWFKFKKENATYEGWTPPPGWTTTSKQIRNRDKRCLHCGKRDGWQSFPVHHLDGDTSNNHPTNLATVCLICHRVEEVRCYIWRPPIEWLEL